MAVVADLTQKSAAVYSRYLRYRFEHSLKNVAKVQEKKRAAALANFLGTPAASSFGLSVNSTFADLQAAVGITDYETWRPWIEQQKNTGQAVLTHERCERYQPTSGSTSAIKWIPYTPSFMADLNHGLFPWLGDMYRQYPGIASGKHYWSVSWVPDRFRDLVKDEVSNDLKLLDDWSQFFAKQIVAVPESVALAPTSDHTMFATLAWLLATRDLTFMSVWSPTYAFSLINSIETYQEDLVYTLRHGRWPSAMRQALQGIPSPKHPVNSKVLSGIQAFTPDALRKLWPKLALVSSWSTANSKQWAAELRNMFPHANFQGKGLWATEAVVTIPFNDAYVLSVNSHYYEFECLETGDVLLPGQLRVGQIVSPIVTTQSGLMRYRIRDQLKVTDFLHQAPCFEFLGRLDGVDLAGEKLSQPAALDILAQVSAEFDLESVSLVAVETDGLPFYTGLFAVKESVPELEAKVAEALDSALSQNFHYNLARDLKQLAPAHAICDPDAIALYESYGEHKGMVAGNIKLEALAHWRGPLPETIAERLKDC